MVEGEEWEAVQREQTQALAGTSGQPLAFICNVQEEMKKSANELSLDNVGGIFVVLLAGMGIACSIAVLGATQSTLSIITTITDRFTTATNIYTTNLPFISLHYLE